MELYGRPHVARRNTTPNVSFLNDAKARASTTAFAAPTTSRNQEKDAVELQVTGGRAGACVASESHEGPAAPPALFTHLSRPPPVTSRPPLERPQSGGVRRPAPGAPALSATTTKQRPSTARESSRAFNRASSSAPLQSDLEGLFTRRQSEIGPEVDASEFEREKHPGGNNNSPLDEAYIRQLKADILFCHQVSTLQQTNSIGSTSAASRSHTHVKNVQNMREGRISSTNATDTGLHSQLARYNYSSDPVQLRSSKTRLEDLLAQSLTQLMRQFLQLRVDTLDSTDHSITEDELQQRDTESIGLLRPTGNQIPFGNGCGSDPASIYASSLVGILQRVEKFRSVIVGLNSEKLCLLKDIQEKDRKTERLNEQLELFKDALAKAVTKNSRIDTVGSSRRRTSDLIIDDNPSVFVEHCRGPEHDIEKDLEYSAQINALEKERLRLEETIRKAQLEHDSLVAQLKLTKEDNSKHQRAVAAMEEQLDQVQQRLAQEVQKHEQQERDLRDALKSVSERCRQLEDINNREKQTLRSDKQDLEARIRKLEEDLHAKTGQLGQNASLMVELRRSKEKIESMSSQLRTVEGKLAAAQRESETWRGECEKTKRSNAQLQQELAGSISRIEELLARIDQTNALHIGQENMLRQTELKLSQAHADVQRQNAVIQHQANQLTLLEEKLSKSVSLDEEEHKKRQKEENTAWHQKVAALEHALAVERQTIQSVKEQHLTSIAVEKEKAEHSVSQAKAISQELETANLCLAERKLQRERELQDFSDQKAQLLDRISRLMGELDTAKSKISQLQQLQTHTDSEKREPAMKVELESRIDDLEDQLTMALADNARLQHEASVNLDQLRVEYELKQRYLEESHRQTMEEEIESYKSGAENALAAELELRQQLDVVIAERDVLLHRLYDERATPRGSALSEARVELQRAKLKIAALEERLNKPETARSKDPEGKAAVLAAREKKLSEDQKSLKKSKQELLSDKKQLRGEREALGSERALVEADRLRNKEEHKLLRQIAAARRDQLAKSTQQLKRHTEPTQSLGEFIATFQLEHGIQWREMQTKWERLQQELDDVDWQLVHMRNRLEELNLNAAPASVTARPKTPMTSPFSDAVAAGKDTVPVAEQLASASKAAIITASHNAFAHKPDCQSDDRPSGGVTRSRDEDHETFAAALAKEMRAMKESYESKLDDLQHEMRKIQKLRMESAQRLRAELDDEKRRSHQIIAQLSDRCAALEAQVAALQRALTLAQDAQIELLCQYDAATTDAARAQILHALHGAVAEACQAEMARRDAREKDRVRKLQDYCGSSSVTVEREDKKRIL